MTEELEANPLYESLSREAAALKLRTEATEERMENLQERIFNKFLIKKFWQLKIKIILLILSSVNFQMGALMSLSRLLEEAWLIW